jgi:IS1 family transposase
MTEEYDMIDRFLRNNLYDDDYETFSAALDELAHSRENETNERNLCQLTDELAAARRENAELKAKIESMTKVKNFIEWGGL